MNTAALPSLIIDRPDLQTGGQRAVFHVLTAAFWLLWVVLWLPLITLLGWAFFGYQFHFQMIRLEGYVGFLSVLGTYSLVIVVMSGALLIWAKYNHLRFRGSDRRKDIAPPTLNDLSRLHQQPALEIERWQNLRIVIVHHQPDGSIERIEA